MVVQDYDYLAEDTALAVGILPNFPALIEETVLDLGRFGYNRISYVNEPSSFSLHGSDNI